MIIIKQYFIWHIIFRILILFNYVLLCHNIYLDKINNKIPWHNSFQNMSCCQFIVYKLNRFDFSFILIWNSLLEPLIHITNCSTVYLQLYISVTLLYVFNSYFINILYKFIICIIIDISIIFWGELRCIHIFILVKKNWLFPTHPDALDYLYIISEYSNTKQIVLVHWI